MRCQLRYGETYWVALIVSPLPRTIRHLYLLVFAKRFSNQIVGREGDAKITELEKKHWMLKNSVKLHLYHNELAAVPVIP